MARIKSASPDFKQIDAPSKDYGYIHGADVRRNVMPVAFQITSPFDRRLALLPHALVMHVNPANWNETHNKKIERMQTRGGYVEQHWFDDPTEISADGSTGAFVNLYTGVTSVLRQRTIAWDRYRDLYDLFRNNGSVYDPYGNVVLQGNVLLMYDRGTYLGYFKSLDVEETEESPFSFRVSWTFHVEETIMQIPGYVSNDSAKNIVYPNPSAPGVQGVGQQNPQTAPTPAVSEAEAQQKLQQQAEFGRQIMAREAAKEAAGNNG